MARSAAQPVAVTTKISKTQSGSRTPAKDVRAAASSISKSTEVREVLALAQARGLLSGTRTHVVRGRMPVELVAQAKRKTGITSDTKLLEAALASIALSDDYADWLLAHRGTVNQELDLEF